MVYINFLTIREGYEGFNVCQSVNFFYNVSIIKKQYEALFMSLHLRNNYKAVIIFTYHKTVYSSFFSCSMYMYETKFKKLGSNYFSNYRK